MTTSTNHHQTPPYTKKRTLRSNSKPSTHNNTFQSTIINDHLLTQIKSEIQHQQANNATKTTFPIENDLRSFDSIIPHLQSSPLSLSNQLHQINQFECFSNDLHIHHSSSPPFITHQDSPDNIQQHFQSLQKKQPLLQTPSNKYKLTQTSPYESKRKSYRKIKKQNLKFVPFRKCQDQLEVRIVALINKICQKKHHPKQIEILCDKLAKISFKDLYNPYVISGVQTISKLLQQRSLQSCTQSRLKTEIKNLSERIWSELGNTDDYDKIIQVKKLINLQQSRQKVVRKVYKLLIHQKKCEPMVARVKSFEVCDSFFTKCNNQTSQEDLIYFLKQQNFLSI